MRVKKDKALFLVCKVFAAAVLKCGCVLLLLAPSFSHVSVSFELLSDDVGTNGVLI